MKKTHSPEQIIDKVRQAEAASAEGATVPEVCKRIEVSEQTYYRWRSKYAGMNKADAKRLRELGKENARLKKLLAEKELDNSILKEALETTEPCEEAERCSARSNSTGCERATRLPSRGASQEHEALCGASRQRTPR